MLCRLTQKQVFEILLKWVETRDWEQALLAVMPQRKFYKGQQTTADDIRTDGATGASDDNENLVVIREEERNDFYDDSNAVQDEESSTTCTDPALEKQSVEVVENSVTID
jgi:tRNA (guanine9-N1)-methyltransferase